MVWVSLLSILRYYRHYSGHSHIEDEFVFAVQPDAFTREVGEKLRVLAQAHGQSLSISNFIDRVLIGVTDSNGFYVTSQTVQAAIEFESIIKPLAGSLIDPPIDSPHCFCPTYHPELWAEDA